jgi:hypothetical protein
MGWNGAKLSTRKIRQKKVSQNSNDYLQHRVRRNPRIYRKIMEITGKEFCRMLKIHPAA